MSKRINVNPDHYKVAGRERQGENIIQERAEAGLRAQQQAESERWQGKRQDGLPTGKKIQQDPCRAQVREQAIPPPDCFSSEE